MRVTNRQDRPTLAPTVEILLETLRLRIRQYIWLEGCAAAVTWLGVAFWLTLAADWFFEPPAAVRAVMLAAVVGVLAVVVVRLIVRRIFVPITNANAAMVLERRFPELNDSLLTAVVLGESCETNCCTGLSPADAEAVREVVGTMPAQDDLSREMLVQTCREAAERIGRIDLLRVFNPRPLYLHVSAALLLTLSVAFFAILFTTEFCVWVQRALAMSDVSWPRSTELTVVGFKDKVRRVARGSDFEVVVRANASKPKVPETVEIRYRTEGGGRGRATMDRRGAVGGPEGNYQEYTYSFRDVLADVAFDVLGGDDRRSGYRIEAVDSPTISQMTLECELPSYIGRKQPPLPVTGVMQIPMGTQVTVHAGQANKDIVGVRVNSVVNDRAGPVRQLTRQELAADGRGFTCKFEPLMADTMLLFALTDSDGIESRDPVRLTLVATPDQAPQLAVQLDGIGTAITPSARVAVAGQISDDYGVGRVWFERAIDQQKPHSHPIAGFRQPLAVYNLGNAALDVKDMRLKVGQKLSVSVKAADLCELGRGANVATTETWQLDVVTSDQLRAILAARELVLRQRFEQMIQEMGDTRDLLARMEFGGEAAGKSETDSRDGPHPKGEGAAEPGDETSVDLATRRREMRILRVQGALTNCHKGAPEVQGVAEGIDDIYKQLINNRIDTVEQKNRLKGKIAEPLHRIVDVMFPELGRRIEELQTALDDSGRAPALRNAAQQQSQAILLAMQKVRDQMIEMEDFNEAVELLRKIIDMQKQLRQDTQKRQNEKIRELLKE